MHALSLPGPLDLALTPPIAQLAAAKAFVNSLFGVLLVLGRP